MDSDVAFITSDVTERIAKVRQVKGVNKKEFAEYLEVTSSIFSDIESGKRKPSRDLLIKISVRYGISLNWLFFGIGKMGLSDAASQSEYRNHPLVLGIDALIKENLKEPLSRFEEHESRLSALESKYDNLSHLPEPEIKYPTETPDDDHVAEPEPVYGGDVLFFDNVAAGPPTWQFTDSGRVIDVPPRLIKTKAEDYYALRVKGNSMIDAFIPDGSLVLIRRSDVPVHGKIQVVRLDDRVTIKRMREEEDNSWTLCYEDGTGQTVPLGEDNQVQGDFVAVLPPHSRIRMRGE